MEGDEGRDAGQRVSGLTGGLGRGRRLAAGSWGAVGAEGDVGHAATGTVRWRLVVVGVGRGGVLKVLLEFLQGDSLEGGGERSANRTRLCCSSSRAREPAGEGESLRLILVNTNPEILMGEAFPKAPSLGRACSVVSHDPDKVGGSLQEMHRSHCLLHSGREPLGRTELFFCIFPCLSLSPTCIFTTLF